MCTCILELPGYTMDEIEVIVTPRQLTIYAVKPFFETDIENIKFHKLERIWGSSKRTIDLPQDVNIDDIGNASAIYENGILSVIISKL